MKKSFIALLLVLSSSFAVLAQSPAPVRPDIEELLVVTRSEKSFETMLEQMKTVLPQIMASATGGQTIPADQTAKLKEVQDKLLALIMEEMSWKKMKPQIAGIYAESLTPEEVKGMTEFYKSPAGQAVLNKMPVIMQKTLQMQQKMMVDLMPKIRSLVETETKDLKK